MKKILLGWLLLISCYSYGFVTGDVEVRGVVVKHDYKFVTVRQRRSVIKIPRRNVYCPLKVGKSILAFFSVEEFNKLIEDNKKK